MTATAAAAAAAARTQTTGSISFSGWQEEPVTDGGGEGGVPTLARATATCSFSGGIEAKDARAAYTIAYRSARVGRFTGLVAFSGHVDGRAGTFVTVEQGHFGEDGTLRGTFEVLPDSGTGELAGLRGEGEYVLKLGEEAYGYTFAYTLAPADG
ncbi:DUF3224 domain-containing protein [Streptomyces sp. JJ66]|uniref:DUF3224 domain-containing protein n=1 Tax=Streptomyces sp. JJ66 TaxID=2803843 RepID=UPI001C57C703|nr:DUF3224 domain-containing protein [Streptomyces sp. JJ66]MBW1604284.1 DUF3224 domain-containing protein [Streptomyces sp. JJ66]